MDGLLEKVSNLGLVSVLILLFVIDIFKPFKGNQKILATTSNTTISTIQAEVESANQNQNP